MEKTFRSKVIVISGGTSGIGKELARKLADYGAHVYIGARNVQEGEALVSALRSSDHHVVFYKLDVQDEKSVEEFVNRVLQNEGRIDYLFHCAGIILGGEIRDHQIGDIQKVLQTNIYGSAYMAYYVYRVMAAQKNGHIINFSSGAGILPVPLLGIYSASKFAVLGLSEALRIEGKGLGVQVSAVAPGIIDTPIYDRATYSKTNKESAKTIMKRRLYTISPDKAAAKILRGTRRNRAIIFPQFYVRIAWLIYRLTPWAFRFFAGLLMGPYRSKLRKH